MSELIKAYLQKNGENAKWSMFFLENNIKHNKIINAEKLKFFINNPNFINKKYYELNIDILNFIKDYIEKNNSNKEWLNDFLKKKSIKKKILKFFINNPNFRNKKYYELNIDVLNVIKDYLYEKNKSETKWLNIILNKIPDMTIEQFNYFKENVSERNEERQPIFINPNDLLLNISIEIDVCSSLKIKEREKLLKYFTPTINHPIHTIKCYKPFTRCEYVIDGYIKNNELHIINNNLRKIMKTSNKYENKNNSIKCKYNSCGLHYYISSENILLNLQGLIFLINFIKEWFYSYQDKCREKFLYKSNIVGKTYAKPFVLDTKQIKTLDKYKNKLLDKIKNGKLFVSNFYLLHMLGNIKLIIDFSSNIPNLRVVEDNKFINIEYSGLLPWDLYRQIREFPLFIKELYLEIIKLTNKEIGDKIDKK
jgi:hypothetical protein